MQTSSRVRFARYLQHRPNFMKVAALSFGLPFAVGMLWMFGSYGGFMLWLLLVLLAVPAGWIWAYFMWFVLENDIRRVSSDPTAQKGNEHTDE